MLQTRTDWSDRILVLLAEWKLWRPSFKSVKRKKLVRHGMNVAQQLCFMAKNAVDKLVSTLKNGYIGGNAVEDMD